MAKDNQVAQKEIPVIERIFDDARSGNFSHGKSLTLPIVRDEDLMTPIDICLSKDNLNI